MILLVSASASACVVCDSETSQQVRAGVLSGEFWPTLAAVVAPFPVLLITIALYQIGAFDRLIRGVARSEGTTDAPASSQ